MANLVELARIGASRHYVSVKGEKSYIQLEISGEDDNFVFFNERKDTVNVTGCELWRWFGRKRGNENIALVYSRIETLFPSSNLILHFHLDKTKRLQNLLSHPSFKNWKTLIVEGEIIEAEDLTFILDMARMDRSIVFHVKSMPSNFSHYKAFQFRDIEHHSAAWIQVEDLFVLRNSSSVTLSLNHFTNGHLNRFLRYWANRDYCMFRQLTIYMEDTSQFLSNQVFENLNYLCYSSRPEYVILSTSSKNLEYPLAIISWIGSTFKVTTVPSDGECAREYRILNYLKKRKQLEDELKKNDDYLLNSELIQKLKKISREMEQLNAHFINGNVFL